MGIEPGGPRPPCRRPGHGVQRLSTLDGNRSAQAGISFPQLRAMQPPEVWRVQKLRLLGWRLRPVGWFQSAAGFEPADAASLLTCISRSCYTIPGIAPDTDLPTEPQSVESNHLFGLNLGCAHTRWHPRLCTDTGIMTTGRSRTGLPATLDCLSATDFKSARWAVATSVPHARPSRRLTGATCCVPLLGCDRSIGRPAVALLFSRGQGLRLYRPSRQPPTRSNCGQVSCGGPPRPRRWPGPRDSRTV